MSAGNTSPGPPVRDQRSLLVAGGHLAALWALAFAQPLFDLLGRNPEFFVARGNTASDILVFSLLFTLVPPLLMLGAEALAGLASARLRAALHLGLIALLIAALALQGLKQLAEGPAGLLVAAALALGAGAAFLYARGGFVPQLLDVLIPAPVVVLFVFLVLSDVSKLVLPQEEAEAANVRVPRPASVVMLVLDELPTGSLLTPAGEIDASRYPAFAELARDATWYRDATTVAGFTSLAVPAVLTGRLPERGALPTSADQPQSVFTLLARSHRLEVMENATQLCPSELCPDGDENRVAAGRRLRELFADLRVVSGHLLLPNALRRRLPDISQTFGGFATEVQSGTPRFAGGGNAEQLAANFAAGVAEDESVRVTEFVSEIEAGEPSTLHMIHVEKPHYPWTHLPDGRRYTRLQSEWLPFLGEGSEWLAPRAVTDIALQRHLLETGFTDHLLGEVIDRLKETGLWREALVVVAADHGGAVIPGQPRRNPTPVNMGEVAPVPVFVKAPGQSSGRVAAERTCTSDVLPIVAAELGIDYPWERWPCPPDRVEVEDEPSGEVAASLERTLRGRDRYVARIERLFGTGRGWRGVFRFGPSEELIGHSVASLSASVSPAVTAELEDAERLQDVDLDAATLPLLQRGSVDGEAGEALAIAVNGSIAAVGETFEQNGEVRFSILLPPGSLREGANRVELFRVLGSGEVESPRG